MVIKNINFSHRIFVSHPPISALVINLPATVRQAFHPGSADEPKNKMAETTSFPFDLPTFPKGQPRLSCVPI